MSGPLPPSGEQSRPENVSKQPIPPKIKRTWSATPPGQLIVRTWDAVKNKIHPQTALQHVANLPDDVDQSSVSNPPDASQPARIWSPGVKTADTPTGGSAHGMWTPDKGSVIATGGQSQTPDVAQINQSPAGNISEPTLPQPQQATVRSDGSSQGDIAAGLELFKQGAGAIPEQKRIEQQRMVARILDESDITARQQLLAEYYAETGTPFLKDYNPTSPEWFNGILPDDATPRDIQQIVTAHLSHIQHAAAGEGMHDIAVQVLFGGDPSVVNTAFFQGVTAVTVAHSQEQRKVRSTSPEPQMRTFNVTTASLNHDIQATLPNTDWRLADVQSDPRTEMKMVFTLPEKTDQSAGGIELTAADYTRIANKVPLPDLDDVVTSDTPNHIYPFLVSRENRQNPPSESRQWDMSVSEKFQDDIRNMNSHLDVHDQISYDSSAGLQKTAFFSSVDDSVFPLHFLQPTSEWGQRANEPVVRGYVTINPADAANIQAHFTDLVYQLHAAGINFEGKAASPSSVFTRADNMVFYFPSSQQQEAGGILANYLKTSGLGQGYMLAAHPDAVPGLSWAPEPSSDEEALLTAMSIASADNLKSFNRVVSVRTTPLYLQRWEDAARAAGLTAKADKIARQKQEMQAIIDRYSK